MIQPGAVMVIIGLVCMVWPMFCFLKETRGGTDDEDFISWMAGLSWQRLFGFHGLAISGVVFVTAGIAQMHWMWQR